MENNTHTQQLNIGKIRSDGGSIHHNASMSEERTNGEGYPHPMSLNASSFQGTNKLNSPSSFNQTQQNFAYNNNGGLNQMDAELNRIMYETENNGFFNMSQVLAASENQQPRSQQKQRSSKQRSKKSENGKVSSKSTLVNVSKNRSNTNKQNNAEMPPPSSGDQYQHFSISGQMFHPSQGQIQLPQFIQNTPFQPSQQQNQMVPQVNFIAQQQKFYQISPNRQDGLQTQHSQPVLFDKKPYTSANNQVMSKRSSAQKVQSSAVAALYMQSGSKSTKQPSQNLPPASSEIMLLANPGQMSLTFTSSTPLQPSKKMRQTQSQPRKHNNNHSSGGEEQLFDECTKLKQQNFDLKDELFRVKQKNAQLENEIKQKEKLPGVQQNQKSQSSESVLKQKINKLLKELKRKDEQLAQQSEKDKKNDISCHQISEQLPQLSNDISLEKSKQVRQSMDRLFDETKLQNQVNDLQGQLEQVKNDLEREIETHQQLKSDFKQLLQEAKQIPYIESQNEELRSRCHELQTQCAKFADLLEQQPDQEALQENLVQEFEQKLTDLRENFESEKEELNYQLDATRQEQEELLSKMDEQMQLIDVLKDKEQLYETKQREMESLVKNLTKSNENKDADLKKVQEQVQKEKADNERKIKSLKDTINELSVAAAKPQKVKTEDKNIQSENQLSQSFVLKESKREKEEIPESVIEELDFITPILAVNQGIFCRVTMIQELKLGLSQYTPSEEVQSSIIRFSAGDLAEVLPDFDSIQKCRLDSFTGTVASETECTFDNEELKCEGEKLSLRQRQFLMGRYLCRIEGKQVFVNTKQLQEDEKEPRIPSQMSLSGRKSAQSRLTKGRKSVDEEQMLDIAELQFIKIADTLIKNVQTVKECFMKYSVPETLPESKAQLDLLPPSAFLKALEVELGVKDLSDLEVACLMRVLAKPELGNAIILNEFALIMENFGVPLIDGTLTDEEDYVQEGEEKPAKYDLTKVDEEGIDILRQTARFLLKEYMHPREFFGKAIKNYNEIKTEKKTYRVDTMVIKDFYLKIKIANIRKTLVENESLNAQLCLDPKIHADLFNVKNFIRALEDIAEKEQEKMIQEEKEQKENISKQDDKPASPGSSPVKTTPKRKNSNDPSEKIETAGFKKNKGVRSPHQNKTKFGQLITIDEVMNETVTSQQVDSSHREDSQLSQHLRQSKLIDFEESVNMQSSHNYKSQKSQQSMRPLSDAPIPEYQEVQYHSAQANPSKLNNDDDDELDQQPLPIAQHLDNSNAACSDYVKDLPDDLEIEQPDKKKESAQVLEEESEEEEEIQYEEEEYLDEEEYQSSQHSSVKQIKQEDKQIDKLESSEKEQAMEEVKQDLSNQIKEPTASNANNSDNNISEEQVEEDYSDSAFD